MKNQRTSTALTNAEARLLGLQAINPHLDFGQDRSITKLSLYTEQLRNQLAQCNAVIVALETSKNELRDLEKQVNVLSSHMLSGVGFEYGQDSYEYELAGGIRTSDRVRKSRSTRLKTAAESASSQSTAA